MYLVTAIHRLVINLIYMVICLWLYVYGYMSMAICLRLYVYDHVSINGYIMYMTIDTLYRCCLLVQGPTIPFDVGLIRTLAPWV